MGLGCGGGGVRVGVVGCGVMFRGKDNTLMPNWLL